MEITGGDDTILAREHPPSQMTEPKYGMSLQQDTLPLKISLNVSDIIHVIFQYAPPLKTRGLAKSSASYLLESH